MSASGRLQCDRVHAGDFQQTVTERFDNTQRTL
jgi:hypothetical protein